MVILYSRLQSAAQNNSKQDSVDDLLEKQDGLIKRERDLKLYIKKSLFFLKLTVQF